MTQAEIVASARELLGTPWGHQGRMNGLALDCAGVVVHVGRALGMQIEDLLNYSELPNPLQMRELLNKHLVHVPIADMQVGDVAWIRVGHAPQHLAIVGDYPSLGEFSLIHSNMSIRRVVEHRLDSVWRSRIHAVWRFPGVG